MELAIEPRVRRERKPGPRMSLTLDETKQLVSQKRSIGAIAELRGCKSRTVVGHIARLVAVGQDLDVEYLMPPPSRMEEIESAFRETGQYPAHPGADTARGGLSYDEIAMARIGLFQRGILIRIGDTFATKETPIGA